MRLLADVPQHGIGLRHFDAIDVQDRRTVEAHLLACLQKLIKRDAVVLEGFVRVLGNLSHVPS